VALAVSAFAVAAVVGAVAGDDGLCDVFALNKSASVFFAGDGEGVIAGEAAAVAFAFRVRFAAGDGDVSGAAAGEALLAGDASVVAAAFLRERFAGEGDAPVGAALAGDASAVAAAFLCVRCFVGEDDAAGEGD
jgi:hypothetical protein